MVHPITFGLRIEDAMVWTLEEYERSTSELPTINVITKITMYILYTYLQR